MLTESQLTELIKYEVYSSWWAGKVSNPWLQSIVGAYFAWKVARKFQRYQYWSSVRATTTRIDLEILYNLPCEERKYEP